MALMYRFEIPNGNVARVCLHMPYSNFHLEGCDFTTGEIVASKVNLACEKFVDVICEGDDLEGELAVCSINLPNEGLTSVKGLQVMEGQLQEIDPYPYIVNQRQLAISLLDNLAENTHFLEELLTHPKSPLVALEKVDGPVGSCANSLYNMLAKMLENFAETFNVNQKCEAVTEES